MIHMRRKHNPMARISPMNNLLLSNLLKPLMLASIFCQGRLQVTQAKGKQTKCGSRIQEQVSGPRSVTGQDPLVLPHCCSSWKPLARSKCYC